MTRWAAPLLCAVALFAACGSDEPDLSEEASRGLQFQVQAIRDAAESFNPAGVEQALAELRASIAQLEEQDKIDEGRAAEILAAAADVEALVDEVPTTTTTTTTLPPPPVEDEDDDEGKGNGKGKGGDD
jgi:hypothetical protein